MAFGIPFNRISIPAGYSDIFRAVAQSSDDSITKLSSLLCRLGNSSSVELFQSARYALYHALRSLPESRNEILTPAFGCDIVPTTIIAAGKIPVLTDIDPYYFCLDPKDTLSNLDSQTSAALMVHEFGNPCLTDAWEHIEANDSIVIEDAAIAYGAYYPDGKMVGTSENPTIISAGVGKPISAWAGGALLNNSQNIRTTTSISANKGIFSSVKLLAVLAISNQYIFPLMSAITDSLSANDTSLFVNNSIDLLPSQFDSELWVSLISTLDNAREQRSIAALSIFEVLDALDWEYLKANGRPFFGRIPIYLPKGVNKENFIQILKDKGIEATVPSRTNLIERSDTEVRGNLINARRAYEQLITLTLNPKLPVSTMCDVFYAAAKNIHRH